MTERWNKTCSLLPWSSWRVLMWFGAWLCSSSVYCVFKAQQMGRPCRFSHCCVHLFALLFVFFDLTLIISVFFSRITIYGTVLVSLEWACLSHALQAGHCALQAFSLYPVLAGLALQHCHWDLGLAPQHAVCRAAGGISESALHWENIQKEHPEGRAY